MNLAGVLPWIHWRGLGDPGLARRGQLLLHGLSLHAAADAGPPLAPGWPNWPRLAAEQMAGASCSWPVSLGLRGVRPVGQPVVDGLDRRRLFRRRPSRSTASFAAAAFCKYVCPIGQFNFVQSLVSPLEVKVRDPDVCASCRTQGLHPRAATAFPAASWHLFQPRKAGNMDCTFCLDCVHACPHDNVGLLAGLPGAELWSDPLRSGIGRFGRRPDLAALVVVLVFGAFANAAGMVGPVVDEAGQSRTWLGDATPGCATTAVHASRPGRRCR